MLRRFAFPLSFLCLALLTVRAASADPPTAITNAALRSGGSVRLDGYGDPLPDGAVFRIGTTRLRHETQFSPPFTNLLLSRDGKFVYSSGRFEDQICMFETAAGRCVRRFPAHVNLPSGAIALSIDGSLLAIGDVYEMHLYDAATGKERPTIQFPKGRFVFPDRITFSPEGRTLTTFHLGSQPEGNRVGLWEIATGKLLGNWKTGADVPVALSADARIVASIGEKDQTIGLWEAASGKKVREWKSEGRIPLKERCLIFSPDGRNIVAAEENGMIRVYETASGKEVRSWKGRSRNDNSGEPDRVAVGWLAFAPDGKILASVDRNCVLRFWDWKTGRELRRFERVSGPIAFSADGKIIAAGGRDARIRTWDTTTGRDLCPFVDPGKTTAIAFSPEGSVLAVGSDRGISRLLDAGDGRERKQIPGYCLLEFSPDGVELLALRQEGERLGPLCLLDAASGKERRRFQDTKESDGLGGWSLDLKILVTTHVQGSFPLRVWDTATGKKLREVRGNAEWSDACCSPDARMVALVDNKGAVIHLFETATGKALPQLTGYNGGRVEYEAEGKGSIRVNTSLIPSFAPNGKVVVGACARNAFALWDAATGKQTVRWNCTQLLPANPIFSADGKWLALLDPHGDPCLVDAATGRVRHRLTWKGGNISWIIHSANRAFSADGRLLAAAYDAHTLVLWEVATGKPIRTWHCDGRGELRQMLFSADSRRLATHSTDGTVLVWDATGLSPDGSLPARKLTAAESEQAWKDLADADAAKGHRAVWSLVADPERAMPLLRKHLHPTPGIDPRRLTRLTADLDSDDFSVREASTRELKKLGELARLALQAALKDKPSLEMRRRAQTLLDELGGAALPAESLGIVRAVAVLEHIGSADARKLLDSLASGAPEARLTQEAAASLARLRSRRVQP